MQRGRTPQREQREPEGRGVPVVTQEMDLSSYTGTFMVTASVASVTVSWTHRVSEREGAD